MRSIFLSCAVVVISLAVGQGCVNPVFTSPVTLSSKSVAGTCGTPIQRVSVIRTSYMFVLIPVPKDPRKGFDELLEAARAVGGDGVVDMRVSQKDGFFWLFPPIVAVPMEYSGMAIKTRE